MTFIHSSEPARRGVKTAATALTLAALAFLSGCADMSGIDSQARMRDAASLGLQDASAAPASTARVSDIATAEIDAQWWRAYGDPQLDALVEQALQGNPSLGTARARLAKAQSAIDVAHSASLPQVNADLGVTRQKFSENYTVPEPLAGAVINSGSLTLDAGWELDFFGKNRAAVAAAVGASNAAQAEEQAARILLSSRVTSAYIAWARLESLQGVARRTLAQREETFKLVRDRVSAGLDTRLELRQSEAGLPEARQRIEELDEQIAIAHHALDALVAQPNATSRLQAPQLDKLSVPAMPAHLPADLLGHRADVVAARWRVEAATQDVSYAKKQFYPNIDLVGSIGYQALGVDKLLNISSFMWSVGPAVKLPIFEGGRLRANLRGKNADLDAAVESYNGTVIDAIRDVADQVASVKSVARQQVQQREGQQAAEGAYDIALQRYRAGLGTYLDVLTAENSVLAQRRDQVNLAARALSTQAQLAQALGGGYRPQEDAAASAGAAPAANTQAHAASAAATVQR
ncbi:efflux transporter outer membrane subunit [Variovorax dokdonensis]|uniref:Efflux transporter outer membrane subunit n=1 Tax=Variovorax dokdonensis TaxID=344883 RepID=A0ABT7NEN5_9BURK|nr:efflux transporter outer membrane subunit [Variovorax dokdonensis]MDM0046410.1 efflux transporter outer membrane subunit [Variovorax dokdonensis]